MPFHSINRKDYTLFYLAFILLFGAALRIYKLGTNSLWFDEGLDLMYADKIISLKDTCLLPFHVILNYCWGRLGSSEFILRLPSAIFGIISILVIYRLGKLFFDKKIGLVSAVILAISPFHIYYSQETRMYSILLLLVLLAVYFLERFLRNGKFGYLFGYVIFTVLSIFVHYIALAVLLAENIFFLIYFKKCKYLRAKWFIGHFIILLLMSPGLLLIFSQLRYIVKSSLWWWVSSISWKTIPITLKNFSIGYNATSITYIPACALYFFLFIWGIYVARRKNEDIALLLFCLFIPILIVFVMSIFKSFYVDRYFISGLPFYLIIVANGIAGLKKRYLIASLFIIFIFSYLSLKNYYSNYLPNSFIHHVGVQIKTDTRSVAKYICENFEEEDLISHADENTVPQIWYYLTPKYRGIIKETDTIFIEADRKIILKYDKIANKVLPFEFSRGAESRVKDTHIFLGKYKRIWVISCVPKEKIIDILNGLDKEYVLLDIKKFYGIDLYLYKTVNNDQ